MPDTPVSLTIVTYAEQYERWNTERIDTAKNLRLTSKLHTLTAFTGDIEMSKHINRDKLRSVKLGARRAFQAKQRQALGRQALADIAAGRSMADILMTATVSRATLYRAIGEAQKEMEAPLAGDTDELLL